MSVPKYFEMHKPTLKFLSDGKVHSAREIKEYLIYCFHLSGEDIMLLVPSGRTTYLSNRAGWARTYLKKAGLIESPSRGKFIITAEGRKALSESPDVIDSDYLMKYDSFREFQSMTQPYDEGIQKGERDVSETPDDILERAFKQINDNLADEILSEVMKLSPAAFEKMVMDLMSKMGYGTFENAAFTTCVTGDEGIDGIIMEDKLGFNLIYIQAKRWNGDHPVGRPEVQAFVGAIAGKSGKGLFVTTSKFTKQAIDYAKNQHIILMDGNKLADYMIEYNFGVSVKKTFEIKAIDSDVFSDYEEGMTPLSELLSDFKSLLAQVCLLVV